MADLPNSSFTAMNDVEIAGDAPLTEALLTKIGSNINYLNTSNYVLGSQIGTQTSPLTFSVTNDSLYHAVSITGSSINIDTDGKIVCVGLMATTPAISSLGVSTYPNQCQITTGSGTAFITVARDGNIWWETTYSSSTSLTIGQSFFTFDTGATGNHTYQIYVRTNIPSNVTTIYGYKLIAVALT